MAENTMVFCESCEHTGTTTEAESWCNDCKEGYCKKCVKAHQVTNALRNHHLISTDEYMKARELVVEETCPDHKRQHDYFCSQHDSILCLECVQIYHSKCKIQNIGDASVGSKSSTAVENLEQEIQHILHNLEIGSDFCDREVADLKKQENALCNKVRETRDKIDRVLNELQGKLLGELHSELIECTNKIEIYKEKLLAKTRKLTKLQQKTLQMKTCASEKQMFIGTKQTFKTLMEEKESVFQAFHSYTGCEISVRIEESLLNFLQHTNKIGDVETRTRSNMLRYIDPGNKGAQLYIRLDQKIDTIRFKLNRSIRINDNTDKLSVTSCSMLPDGSTIFADNKNSRLIIHDCFGKYKKDISLRNHLLPYDTTVVDYDKVAVSYSGENFIDLFNISSNERERSLTGIFKTRCWGISCDSQTIYCVAGKEGIVLIDKKGRVIKTLPARISNTLNITSFKEKFYYLDWSRNSLHCCDIDGNTFWVFYDGRIRVSSHHFLVNKSTSLSTDQHGNVFIALPDSDSIIVVSADGQQSRVILDKSDKLLGPSGVFCEKNNRQLLVSNAQNGYAAVYDIVYKPL